MGAQCQRLLCRPDNQEVGLEAAILERVRNSSLVEWCCADNVAGLKPPTDAADQAPCSCGDVGGRRGVVGERPRRRGSRTGRCGGAPGSANAGMSSVKADAKSAHRKPKGSYGRVVRVGLGGPKPRPQGVGDGQPVSIPAPVMAR